MQQTNLICHSAKNTKGSARPIVYQHYLFNKVYQAYDTTVRETLEFLRALFLLRLYLEWLRFTVFTNPNGMHCIINMSDYPGKLACWLLYFAGLDFVRRSAPR